MGTARGATDGDMFREADHSKDDKDVQTIAVRNQNFVFYARVTVIEVD